MVGPSESTPPLMTYTVNLNDKRSIPSTILWFHFISRSILLVVPFYGRFVLFRSFTIIRVLYLRLDTEVSGT